MTPPREPEDGIDLNETASSPLKQQNVAGIFSYLKVLATALLLVSLYSLLDMLFSAAPQFVFGSLVLAGMATGLSSIFKSDWLAIKQPYERGDGSIVLMEPQVPQWRRDALLCTAFAVLAPLAISITSAHVRFPMVAMAFMSATFIAMLLAWRILFWRAQTQVFDAKAREIRLATNSPLSTVLQRHPFRDISKISLVVERGTTSSGYDQIEVYKNQLVAYRKSGPPLMLGTATLERNLETKIDPHLVNLRRLMETGLQAAG